MINKLPQAITDLVDATSTITERKEQLKDNKYRFKMAYEAIKNMFRIVDMDDFNTRMVNLSALNKASFDSPKREGQEKTTSVLLNFFSEYKNMFVQYTQLSQSVRAKYGDEMSAFLNEEAQKNNQITDPLEFAAKFREAQQRLIEKTNEIADRIKIDIKKQLYKAYVESDPFKELILQELQKHTDEKINASSNPAALRAAKGVRGWADFMRATLQRISNARITEIDSDSTMTDDKYPILSANYGPYEVWDRNFTDTFLQETYSDIDRAMENDSDLLAAASESAPAPAPGVTPEAAPEQQEPKVTDIKVEARSNKPALVIEGTNLPQIAPIEMQLQNAFATLKLRLISGVKDIVLPENLQTIDAHINAMIKNQLAAPSDNPQRLALAAYFGDLLNDSKISELKEKIFPPGSKPTLKIIGSSSFEGNLAYNQKLAKDRAESAYRALKASNPDIDRIYNIEKDDMVVGPEGEKVTDVNAAWNKLVELWNKNFNLEGDNALDLPKLKARMKASDLLDSEKKYIATMFDENRGASIQVLPPADKPQSYNVEFRNLPTIPSAPAEGVAASTPA